MTIREEISDALRAAFPVFTGGVNEVSLPFEGWDSTFRFSTPTLVYSFDNLTETPPASGVWRAEVTAHILCAPLPLLDALCGEVSAFFSDTLLPHFSVTLATGTRRDVFDPELGCSRVEINFRGVIVAREEKRRLEDVSE